MKSRALERIIPLLLILSIPQLAVSINYPTNLPTQAPSTASTFTTSTTITASQPQPCLTPTPADTSVAQMQPDPNNGTIAGNVVQPVRNKKVQNVSRMPGDFLLRMEVVFKIRNPAAFQSCLDSISDPSSSNYGHFLNATMLQPYTPTQAQKSSITSYLAKRGLNVTNGASPLVLQISGNVKTTEKIFGLRIGVYRGQNAVFYAADSDPKMPQNYAVLVDAVIGMDNYTAAKPVQTPCTGPYCPQGIQVGYSLSSLYLSGYNGSGLKVAVVDAPGDPNIQSAINTYDAEYGLSATTLDIRYPDGSPSSYDPGWASETAMDVEAVHAVAPGATIVLLYDSFSLMNAIDYVATNHLAPIVSNSWVYTCGFVCSDTQLTSSLVSSVHSRLALDVAQGLTILFASGDNGARPDGSTFGTEFPASDPNVLAIGATNLVLSGCGASTCSGYSSETGASISGGGYSGYFAEPSWQTSGIGTKTGRAVPDVSMLGYSPSFWVYSTSSDKCGRGGNSAGWFGCAGTSLSTPLWAGFLAVALQRRGGGQFGNISPLLYASAVGGSYSSIFHDVASGSNGYSAGTGWDPVTGWGTPIANNLAAVLAQLKGTTDKSTYTQGENVGYSGNGFTAGGAVNSCLSTDNDGTLLCTSAPNADNQGNVAGAMLVGTNVPPGPQKFLLNDIATGRNSNSVQLTINPVFTVSYSVVGGGTGYLAPVFNYVQGGAAKTSTLTTTTASISVDWGSLWSVTPNPLTGSTTSERWQSNQVLSGTATTTLTVVFTFQHQYFLTTQSTPAEAGSVTPSSEWQNAGATITIQATPNSGRAFYSWIGSGSGSFSGTTNPSSVTMNGPITETANFLTPSLISLGLSSSSISLGGSVTLSGTITPTQLSGTVVVLSLSLDDGASWGILTTTQLNSTADYSAVWSPPYPGTYQLKASWGGNANYAGATSNVATLAVTGTRPPQISLLLSGPGTATRGSSIAFDVLATNPGGSGVTSTLYLEITGPNGYHYFDTLQVSLAPGGTGRFQFNWQVPSNLQPGSYQILVGLIPPASESISQTLVTVT